MKALRKKYGKRPWIDTPNATWYRKQCQHVKFIRAAMLNAMGAVGYSQVQAIRSMPAAGAIDQAKKAMAMAEAFVAQTNAARRIIADHPMPSPNPSLENRP